MDNVSLPSELGTRRLSFVCVLIVWTGLGKNVRSLLHKVWAGLGGGSPSMGVYSCDLNLGCSSCSPLLEAAWASSCCGTMLPQWVSEEEESRLVSGKDLAGASIVIYGSPFHRT